MMGVCSALFVGILLILMILSATATQRIARYRNVECIITAVVTAFI